MRCAKGMHPCLLSGTACGPFHLETFLYFWLASACKNTTHSGRFSQWLRLPTCIFILYVPLTLYVPVAHLFCSAWRGNSDYSWLMFLSYYSPKVHSVLHFPWISSRLGLLGLEIRYLPAVACAITRTWFARSHLNQSQSVLSGQILPHKVWNEYILFQAMMIFPNHLWIARKHRRFWLNPRRRLPSLRTLLIQKKRALGFILIGHRNSLHVAQAAQEFRQSFLCFITVDFFLEPTLKEKSQGVKLGLLASHSYGPRRRPGKWSFSHSLTTIAKCAGAPCLA